MAVPDDSPITQLLNNLLTKPLSWQQIGFCVLFVNTLYQLLNSNFNPIIQTSKPSPSSSPLLLLLSSRHSLFFVLQRYPALAVLFLFPHSLALCALRNLPRFCYLLSFATRFYSSQSFVEAILIPHCPVINSLILQSQQIISTNITFTSSRRAFVSSTCLRYECHIDFPRRRGIGHLDIMFILTCFIHRFQYLLLKNGFESAPTL